MRRKRYSLEAVVGAGIVALILAGCSAEEAATQSFSLETIVGSWTLQSGEGPNGTVSPVPSAPIILEVASDGAVTGTAGCNVLNTKIEVMEGGAVTIGQAATTLMACGADVMAAEYAYTGALSEVTMGAIVDGNLELTGNGVTLVYSETVS